MAYDAVTTAAVAAELRERLTGGRVDKILQPSTYAVALLVRSGGANHWLLLSADPRHARAALSAERVAKAFDEPSPFVMLLRKHLDGARLDTVEQAGRDRVLRLGFRTHAAPVTLIAEVMGKHSNVILVDDKDTILGAVKRITAELSRHRVVLPRHPYTQPPAQRQPPPRDDRPKLDPLAVAPDDLTEALDTRPGDAPLAAALVDVLTGVSPQLAKEVAYRLTGATETSLRILLERSADGLDGWPPGIARRQEINGSPSDSAGIEGVSEDGRHHAGAAGPPNTRPDVGALLDALRALFVPERWQPSIVRRDGKVLGWAAYPLRQHGVAPELYPSISAVLEEVYSGLESGDTLGSARAGLRASIEGQRARLDRKIESLRAGLRAPEVIDALRLHGEMVLAFAHEIAPGQSELRLDDPPLVVPLDHTLTPSENAQSLFARYRKLRDAASRVPPLLEEAEAERQFLDAALLFVEQADSPQALKEVRDDVIAAGVRLPGAKERAPRPQPKGKGGKYHPGGKEAPRKGPPPALRFTTRDGLEVLVGRSARQNETVTFDLASGGDLWFHARGLPGSHVVLKTAGRTPPDGSVLEAAELAAYYSRGRGSTTVPVDVVPARSVRRAKGGKPGLVLISGETTLNVRPHSERE